MVEYMPLFQPGTQITRQASASVTGGQLVVVSGSGTVAPSSGATHAWVGVAAVDAVSGDDLTVYRMGVQRLTASGSITAGQTVEPAANGAVAAHTNGTNDINVVGLALTDSGPGGLVQVKLRR
ncbi:capsid cement protein [Microbacterium proteolyticum]|uniref:capsid cement protein n=1 Tax=Microbacterium proteolyticum TaxID=1572644 RepID=UPI002416283E|nr:capsid cement protein [Microbacterium proteolyticum]